jgi:exopolysaccharide biosynthesis polyprenyl glycosylphosphotransferase
MDEQSGTELLSEGTDSPAARDPIVVLADAEPRVGAAVPRLQIEPRRVERRGGDRPAGDRAGSPPADRTLSAEIAQIWDLELKFGPAAGRADHGRRRDSLLRRSLGASDVISAYLALMIALILIPGQAVEMRPAAILIAPLVVLVSKALGLYDRDQHRIRKTTIDEAPSLLHLAAIYVVAVWLGQGLVVRGDLARDQVIALAVVSLLLMIAGRTAARWLATALSPPERCLVVGDDDDVRRTALKLSGSAGVKAEVVGFFSISGDELRSVAAMRILREMITRNAVERVIIAPDGHEADAILHCIRLVKALGVKVSVAPRLLEVVGTSSVVDEVQGTTLLGVRQYGLSKSSEILKRMTDVLGASAALALLSPLFALLCVAICLDSRGGPFYRQPRIGRRGERFSMLKFRSMVTGADAFKEHYRELNEAVGGLFKIAVDPRVTPVGRFLRRTSLDELPQLLNVLKGDMSLVGPRPLVVDEDALVEGWERRRLAVKPGMTGLWQIFGSARIPLPEMVIIDYSYGANWSIWLDLKILLRTVPYVLFRRGM